MIAITWALEIIGTASKAKVSVSCQGLARQEAGLGEVAFDAAAVAFGQFMLGDRGQKASSGPAFLVSLFGGHMSLMAGKRSSLRSRLSLAVSTVVLVFMPRLPSGWRRAGLHRH